MAATSKLVAASATYPYQVVRARLQVSVQVDKINSDPMFIVEQLQDQDQKYNGACDMIRKIIRYVVIVYKAPSSYRCYP